MGRRILSRLRNEVARRAPFLWNVSWVALDNIVQGITALIVAIVIARLLGPDAFGAWTYALAIYAFALSVASLGTEQTIVLDIVKEETRSRSVLATSFAMRLIASIAASVILGFLALARSDHDPELAALLAILALALPVMAADVSRMWFRAHMRFEVPAAANVATTVLGGAVKILLVLATGSLIYAGLAHVAQVVALQVALVVLLLAGHGRLSVSDLDRAYAKSLMQACLPLVVADLAVIVYLRANILLLDIFRGPAEVGVFSAAARISEAVYLLPTVIAAVAGPAMYRQFSADRALFVRRFDQLLAVLNVSIALISTGIALFADPIVALLFGPNFTSSAAVLVLHAWTAMFVAQGLVSTIWLLAEKAATLVLIRTVAGAIINVALGLLLIPYFGARGAAVATLVAMAVSSMIMLVLLGTLGREIFAHQVRSLLPISLWRSLVSRMRG